MAQLTVLNMILYILLDIINSQSCYYHTKSLPAPLFGHIAVYSNYSNSVYIFGGTGANATYKWDLNTQNSWFEQIGTTPTSVFSSFGNNAVIANDIIYFIGMQDTKIAGSVNIYMFDIHTESWLTSTQLTTPPIPLSHGCLTTNNTHIFMVDGFDGNTTKARSPVIQMYDITADIWTRWNVDFLGPYLGGWRYQYCSMLNNQLYILGGRISSSGTSSLDYSNQIYKFDPITATLTSFNDTLPIAQAWGVAVHFDNFIYTVGSFPYTVNISVFDINTETVTNTIYEMTEQLSAPASVILNNKLYIFGGEIYSNPTYEAIAKVQICNLITDNPTYHPTISPIVPTISPIAPTISPIAPTVSPIAPTFSPIIPTSSPVAPSKSPTDATTPILTVEPTTSPLTTKPTNSPVTSTMITTSTVEPMSSNDVELDADETKENSSSSTVVLVLVIIGVSTLCLILLFCVLIYFRLRKSSSGKDEKNTDSISNLHQMKSISSVSPFVSNSDSKPKYIDDNDIELENVNSVDLDIATNDGQNEMNDRNGMHMHHGLVASPGERGTSMIITGDDDSEELEGVGLTHGMTEPLQESDEMSDNELYKKGNKTKGGNEQNVHDEDLTNECDINPGSAQSN